jgi:hypothetical protein
MEGVEEDILYTCVRWNDLKGGLKSVTSSSGEKQEEQKQEKRKRVLIRI